MFDEAEPGKPKNWGWTIGIVIAICFVNLIIFVIIRVLLDAEDEFGESLIKGQFRQDLIAFLGVFAMSFCFGCWCCFCCAGKCFEILIFCCQREKRQTVSRWWASAIHQRARLIRRTKSTISRSRKETSNSDATTLDQRSKQSSTNRMWRGGYDNEVYADSDVEAQIESRPIEKSVESKRPVKLQPDVGESPRMESTGRRSVQWMEMRRPSLVVGEKATTSVGVKNVDYYEIPVSLVTPGAVAIVDPAFAGQDGDNGHRRPSIIRKVSDTDELEMVSLKEATRQETNSEFTVNESQVPGTSSSSL